MNAGNILSWIALLGGEAIIIAAFILFRGDLADNILVLNIIVSLLIYGLLFVDILIPWINWEDKSQNRIGSLGLRWFFTWLYAIAAITVILMANLLFGWSFVVQIIVHCILLFLLTLGFVAVFTASGRVHEIYRQEMQNRNGINEMKSAMCSFKERMSMADLPDSFKKRINSLEEGLRFISPANNCEAYDLERAFTNTVNDLTFAISNYTMSEEAIESNLQKLERIYQNRKKIYSF